MAHGYIVAAFKTSGDAPGKGGRITQLLLVKISDDGKEGAKLQLPEITPDTNADGMLKPVIFSRLVEFARGRPIVIHDGYNWKRFLRQEFASEPKDQVKSFLAQTIDVSEWSQRHFPRKRKDVEAILKRLKIVLPSELSGLERETAAIHQLIPHIKPSFAHVGKVIIPPPKVASAAVQTKHSPQPLFIRLRRAWRVLTGNIR